MQFLVAVHQRHMRGHSRFVVHIQLSLLEKSETDF
jgi:hypothetical protein